MTNQAKRAFAEGVRQALEVLLGKHPAKAAKQLLKNLAKVRR